MHTGSIATPCPICGRLGCKQDFHSSEQVEIVRLRAEVERLNGLLYGARCVYCGEVVGKETKNQDLADEVLRQHVLVCPKHPLTCLRARVEADLVLLERLWTANTQLPHGMEDELRRAIRDIRAALNKDNCRSDQLDLQANPPNGELSA